MEVAPPPRHVWSNVFIWADGLVEGDNYFSSLDNMRAGLTCEEGQALFRVRLIKVGPEPVVYRKVWWDEEKVEDTVYVERPPPDPEGEYIVNPNDYNGLYPARVMEGLDGDWYYVDWMWRDAVEPHISYKIFPQNKFPQDLFERVVKEPDPPYTEWNNLSEDQNITFECLVKLAPYAQDAEVEDHHLCPHNRVTIEVENKQNPDGSWHLFVVEHYFVEQ